MRKLSSKKYLVIACAIGVIAGCSTPAPNSSVATQGPDSAIKSRSYAASYGWARAALLAALRREDMNVNVADKSSRI